MSSQSAKPVLGVSSCLMGHAVRFDGGHKHCHLLTETWKDFFEFRSACPEAELGLGVPRPVIQLREMNNEVRLVFSKQPQRDLTEEMERHAEARIRAMGVLDGYVFKKDSPTCGMERVAVTHETTGQKTKDGVGVFARIFMELNPLVPVEEEGRLNDQALRDNFLQRVYCHYRWRHIPDADNNLHGFLDFHRRHKFMLMARHQQLYRELGRLVASVRQHNLRHMRQLYIRLFMEAMKPCPTAGQHVNVLMHVMGYFKDNLNTHDKAELLNWFNAYRSAQVPHSTPLALIRHYLRVHPQHYIHDQHYLQPYPDALRISA